MPVNYIGPGPVLTGAVIVLVIIGLAIWGLVEVLT